MTALSYQPPYAWDRILAFLNMRAIPGVETVQDGTYWRTVHLPAPDSDQILRGWISVCPNPERNQVEVEVSESLLQVVPEVLERVEHQFDLNADTAAIAEGLSEFSERFPDKFIPGTRVPGCFDVFEMCVRAILGQQISVKGASTLAGRVAKELGHPVETPVNAISCTFPSASDVVALGDTVQDVLGSLGVVGARSRTIGALAKALASGEIKLFYGADPDEIVPQLESLPGIGPWTAQYIAMRATGYSDAFPSTDLGIKKALDPLSKREIEDVAECWRPWRSYATLSLWSGE